MNLNELKDRAYKCACEHGFHEEVKPDEHYLMLTIGEVAEMVEADRKNDYPDVEAFDKCDTINDRDFYDKFERFIKNTVWDECADVVIRLFDFAGMKGYDLEVDYSSNMTNDIALDEKSISILGYLTCSVLTDTILPMNAYKVVLIIKLMYKIAHSRHTHLSWFIQQKMRYNELRPYMNGKRY